ncbi:MAG: glycosyl hydrolase 108 family protein [Actinomycetes bacterium]
MDINSAQFQQFVKHILSFEGGLSKDPRDTAVRYAPFPGAYHTNKGVTYAAFTALGPKIGITPINYEKFIKLTDAEIAKFIYEFYKSINGPQLPGTVGLSVAEAAWGSGPKPAIRELQQALINLKKLPAINPKTGKSNVDGIFGNDTLQAVAKTNEKQLYDAFWKVRKNFIDTLKVKPGYTQYANGWTRRYTSFLTNIKPVAVTGLLLLTGLAYLVYAEIAPTTPKKYKPQYNG